MSNLMKHAEAEMRRAGLYDKGSDYDGMIPEAVMALVKIHSEQGHSGMSHSIVLQIFNKVIQYKPLTPLTDDPEEWMAIDRSGLVQSRRQPTAFSTDGGKSWYDIDDEHRAVTMSAPAVKK